MPTSLHDPEATLTSATAHALLSGFLPLTLIALLAVCAAALALGLSAPGLVAAGQILSAATGGPGWP